MLTMHKYNTMASVRYVGEPPGILFISTLVSNLVIYHFKLLLQCHDNTDLVLKLFEFDLRFAVFVKNQGDCDRSSLEKHKVFIMESC